ncbi:kinase-like domain-containing protein, partial [Mycena olivaceomarginata]
GFQGFNRECEIWNDLWKADQSKHVLPFYGSCHKEDPFPYMMSPWQSNGDALTYVKKYDTKIDYIQFIKGVALGIRVLHEMNPSIVHGNIKASNIVVDVSGNPLIAGFGLSQIGEDIEDIPFHKFRATHDSLRHFAHEMCIIGGVMSLCSDVCAYGRTVLELLTHEQPFNQIKHATEVAIRSAKGEQPPRPTELRVVERGLDDALWGLLSRCWTNEPSQRPTIQEVLDMLP